MSVNLSTFCMNWILQIELPSLQSTLSKIQVGACKTLLQYQKFLNAGLTFVATHTGLSAFAFTHFIACI